MTIPHPTPDTASPTSDTTDDFSQTVPTNPRPITGDALRDAVLRRYMDRRRRAAAAKMEDDPGSAPRQAPIGHPIALAFLARLARTIGELPDPALVATEGRVLLLRTDDPADRTLPALMSREVLPTLAALLGRPAPRSELVIANAWNKVGNAEWSIVTEDLTRIMAAGQLAIIACNPAMAVPDEIADLLDVDVSVPGLSPDDIIAIMDAVERPGRDDPDLLGLLPSAERLAAIGPLHLAYAWAATDEDGAAEVARRLARAADRIKDREPEQTSDQPETANDDAEDNDIPALRLADLRGLGPAGDLLRRLVDDVDDWRDGHLDWRDVGASVLLSGPPGCGKSSAAAAIAGEIGGPVVDLSYTRMQAAGHMGEALRALDKAVAQARSEAPCVVLVDEVDDLADRGGHGANANSHNRSYMRSIVNAYLTRLTQLADAPGVVVVLATNHPHLVDPALIRAGRVDHHLHIGLPDRAALEEILADALGDHAAPALVDAPAWSMALDALTGGSGADAAKLVRDAVAAARTRVRRQRTGRTRAQNGQPAPFAVTPNDLAVAASASRSGTSVPPDLHRLAIHEAGHIVAAHALGRPRPSRAWIGPQGAGVTAPVERTYTADTARAELACLLAGMEAERLILGTVSSGAGAGALNSDLAKATAMAARIASEWHLETEDAPPVWRSAESYAASPDWAHRRTAEAVERLLTDARARCVDLLREWRAIVARVAGALLRERELNGDAIARLLDGPFPASVPPHGSEHVSTPDESRIDGGPQ
ncbi:AAA family ATPase [Jannaschia pohangensis]|uniref:ATP-dependent Zn proteases n=1 Tax=Jannaschia pohangensis TaxID=390807 RepID=A0A1I3Q0D0_9RHOB|nr:AAA family ATPase [Jannaschia pohangensis]SFJ26606.1 ATP-dependent Zn proteases [Jannaschia pohangensis]